MVYLATPPLLLLWAKGLVVVLTGPAWHVDQDSRLHVSILQSSLPDSEMRRDLSRHCDRALVTSHTNAGGFLGA